MTQEPAGSDDTTGGAVLSVGVATFGAPTGGTWRHLLDVARAADDAGIGRLVLPDHVVLGPNVADYPWGRFPTGPEADWLEPLTTIAALAAVTERVRFLTGVLVAPLRPAALLAKTVATLDVLSDGRIDLGVGTGWQREEYVAHGLDFAERGPLLTATIASCRDLWSGQATTVTGHDGTTTGVWCAPTPIQARLPVWFSGTLTARNRHRIGHLGDGWIPIMGATAADVADGAAELRAAFAEQGRDPATLQVRAALPVVRTAAGAADVDATLAAAPELLAAGATDVHLPLRAFDPDGTDPAGTFQRLARAFAAATS